MNANASPDLLELNVEKVSLLLKISKKSLSIFSDNSILLFSESPAKLICFYVDVDDCASKPCSVGSQCIDEVGGYRCVCPAGRFGALCDRLIVGRNRRSCAYKGNLYVHSYSWAQQCNKCTCVDGDVKCTQLDCGPKACSAFNPSCNIE